MTETDWMVLVAEQQQVVLVDMLAAYV